jgi:hypothetical protein
MRLRANVDAVLDDLASGDAQIVPLEVRLIPGACCTVLLTFLLGLVAGGHHDRSTRSSRQPQTKAGSGAHGLCTPLIRSHQRIDLNAARISSEKSSGSSHAAK